MKEENKVLRSGNPKDVEKYFQKHIFWRNELLPTVLAAFISMGILVAFTCAIAYLSTSQKAALILFFYVLYAHMVMPGILIISYDGVRDKRYFFADIPNINGWKWLKLFVLLSPFFPAMLISQRAMKRKRQSDLEWELNDAQAVLALAHNTDDATQKALMQYCLANWKDRMAQEHQENQRHAEDLREQIRTYEREIENIYKRLAKFEQNLADHPEDEEPDQGTYAKLASVYENLKAIPEVLALSARQNSNGTTVEIAINIEHTLSDQTKYNLGLYSLSFTDSEYFDCHCLSSGMTAAGHDRFHVDNEAFCQGLAKIMPVSHFCGRLDKLVEKFIETVRQRKIAGLPEEDLHYYFCEIGTTITGPLDKD